MKLNDPFPLFPLFSAALLASCFADSPRPQFTVRDSAGISIVEHAPPDWTRPTWDVDSVPVVSIGKVEGEDADQLFSVRDATRGGDGSIYVVNASTAEIRVFDSQGIYVRSIGRRGRGPGELRYPVGVWLLPDDSVVVWDAPLGPRVVYAPDGQYVRTDAFDRAVFMDAIGAGPASEDVRPLPGGGYLAAVWVTGSESTRPTGEMRRPPFELMLLPADLSTTKSLREVGGIAQMMVDGADRPMPVVALFSAHYQIALAPHSGLMAVGNGDVYAIEVFDATGHAAPHHPPDRRATPRQPRRPRTTSGSASTPRRQPSSRAGRSTPPTATSPVR